MTAENTGRSMKKDTFIILQIWVLTDFRCMSQG